MKENKLDLVNNILELIKGSTVNAGLESLGMAVIGVIHNTIKKERRKAVLDRYCKILYDCLEDEDNIFNDFQTQNN